jgi:hypothetical protein
MKASTQNNDFKGTVAADLVSVQNSLSQYLQKKGANIEQYHPVGIEASYNYDNYDRRENNLCFSIICQDRNNDNAICKIAFEEEQSAEEFFNLFWRLNVILIQSSINLDHMKDEPEIIYFDNRGKEQGDTPS